MSSENEIQETDDEDRLVWGAKAMAPYLNSTVRKTYHLIASGYLGDAVTQVGKLHVSTPRKLREKVLGREENSK